MIQLVQARNDLRVRLDELSARAWLDPQLDGWINEGARDIARRLECLQAIKDIPVNTGVQQSPAPTDMIRINRMEWKPTGQTTNYPLEFRNYNDMDSIWWTGQQQNTGVPQFYSMWGFPPQLNICLFPTPSSSGTLRVFYYRLPADVTSDNQIIEVPEGWQDLVVDYAEFMALRRDGQLSWQDAKTLYEQKLMTLMDVTRQYSDQPGRIGDSGGMGGLPNWLTGGY